MKELTILQTENGKNNLIKLKNDLIKKFKKNIRIKKGDRDYYEYEYNKFHGLKDVRNLFDQNDGDNDIYEGIEYLFSENDLEYEEIKEYANNIYEIIGQEEINYEHEHTEEANYVKTKPYLIDDEQIIGEEKKTDREYKVVEEKKIECCKVEDQNDIGYEEIIEEKIECKIIEEKIECELIEDKKVDYYEEIKKLLSVKSKKECREYIINEGIIKQEEDIDYDVNYYRANYRKCERVQEIDYIKYKPCPIVDFEITKCKKS